MQDSQPLIRNVSDTALWTAAYRAQESERSDALFHDPYGARLAGDRGFEIAKQVKQPAVRFAVTVRTAVIDELVLDAIRNRGVDTVVNLAAGLDARPYRLELPPDLSWIEVDLPDLIAYKDEVLASEAPRCALRRVPLDLADPDGRRTLFDDVDSQSRRVLVLAEGLLSYLTPEHVGALADDLIARPHFAEWVTDITGAQVVPRLKSAGDHLKAEGEARARFAPAEGTAFFVPHGWVEAEFRDLFYEGPRLGRDSLPGKVVRGLMRIMPAEKRKGLERGIGVVRLVRGAAVTQS
jgi:methyltransferase (TIGR00027 family)